MRKKFYKEPKVVFKRFFNESILSQSGDGITWKDDLSSYDDI